MMYLLFEDKPDIKIGLLLNSSPGHHQVQSLHGKQQKIKDKTVLLQWQADSAEGVMDSAKSIAESLDAHFLWSACPEGEFSYLDFAQEYFGNAVSIPEKLGMLIALRESPIFFRKGLGDLFRKSPEAQVTAAMAGAERRALQESAINAWVSQLCAQQLPENWDSKWARLLTEKQSQPSLEQKAMQQAAKQMGKTPEEVLWLAKAFADWSEYHVAIFAHADYPDTEALDDTLSESAQLKINALPIDDIQGEVFSIDDEQTDEIDDALSVEILPQGFRLGIHIAAPSLAGDDPHHENAVHRFAERLSTVYHPTGKIPMMGERHGKSWVDFFSLDEHRVLPVVSLFITVDESLTPMAHETRVHRVRIDHNLRLQAITNPFNAAVEEHRAQGGIHPKLPLPSDFPLPHAFNVLWQFAQKREAERVSHGAVRMNGQSEYRFEVVEGVVNIFRRERGAPLDALVAEMMIYANQYWSTQLRNAAIPAIFRVKDEGKVGFTTVAGKHTSMGLACYGWFTSPLRRMVDFCNQRQLIAFLRGESPPLAAWRLGDPPKEGLSAPWHQINLEMLAHRANSLTGVYRDFQDRMERYWCLRYLDQRIRALEKLGKPAVFPTVLLRQSRYPALLFQEIPLTAKLSPEAMNALLANHEDEVTVRVGHIDYQSLGLTVERVRE